MGTVRKNIFWLLLSQGATWIATLATLLIVPNKLGSTEFGTYGFATGYVQFFTLVAGLGTSIYLSRSVARDHTLLGPYVWNAALLKVGLWVLLSAAALGLAVILGNTGQTLLIIAISCLGMLPFLLTEVFVGALAGLQQMARPAIWVVAQVWFQTAFGIGVLLLGWGVVAYTVVMTAGIFIPCIATAVMVHPLVKGHRVFQLGIWRLLIWGGVPLVALNFLTLIYGSVDVPILHSIAGSDPVAWYVVALRWASIPVFMTTAVVGAYFPLFAKHGNPATSEFAPLVNRANNIVLLVMIPASVGLLVTAGPLVELLYDDSYESAIVLVQILAVGIPIMGMDTVLTTALVASDRLARYLWFAAAAAVLNPLLCIVAINVADDRWGNGAIGAAVITVATELFVMVGALVMRSPGVLDRAELVRMARILAASALMVPVLLVAYDLPLPVMVVLGVLTYAAGSFLFGSFSIGEARDVIRQVKSSRSGSAPEDGTTEGGPAEDEVMVPPMSPGPDEPPML